MMRLLLSPLLGLLKSLLSAFGVFQWGRERERRKAAEGAAQRTDKGRQGAAEAQQDLKDGKTPEQIVRDNDGQWR